jgi:hypothetical protein
MGPEEESRGCSFVARLSIGGLSSSSVPGMDSVGDVVGWALVSRLQLIKARKRTRALMEDWNLFVRISFSLR